MEEDSFNFYPEYPPLIPPSTESVTQSVGRVLRNRDRSFIFEGLLSRDKPSARDSIILDSLQREAYREEIYYPLELNSAPQQQQSFASKIMSYETDEVYGRAERIEAAESYIRLISGAVLQKFVSIAGTAVENIITDRPPTLLIAPEVARKAHHFRAQRFRAPELERFARGLQTDPAAQAAVSAMAKRRNNFREGTQSEGETHRAFTPYIAGAMVRPESRRSFMGSIQEAARNESAKLKAEARENNGFLDADVIIVGTGPVAATFAAQYRARNPEARIIAVDSGARLGGQFASYGERPVFRINSRNFRPQNKDKQGVPDGKGNLNSFGDNAVIQLPDFISETYPTNKDFGDAAAVNSFTSMESMLDVRATAWSDNQFADKVSITVDDLEGGDRITIEAKKLIVSSGIGERRKSSFEGVWTAEEVLAHFANEENLFPLDEFAGKRVALRGGGDTGRIMAEIFTGLAPKEAYGYSVIQGEGLPSRVDWYGTNFSTRQEFCDTNRARYYPLGSFIGGESALLFPDRRKVGIAPFTGENGKVVLVDVAAANYLPENERPDIIIDCTPQPPSVTSLFSRPASEMSLYSSPTDSRALARKPGNRTYILGAAAQLPLTQAERRTFAAGIKENTASLWANGALRAQVLADMLARQDALSA